MPGQKAEEAGGLGTKAATCFFWRTFLAPICAQVPVQGKGLIHVALLDIVFEFFLARLFAQPRRCLRDRKARVGDGQTTHAKRLARAGLSDEFARMALRSGASPSRLEVPARGKARRLAAKDLAAAKARIADHRSAKADVLAARDRSPGTAAGEQADERCCLGAPPTADFNAENDKVATPRADQLRVRPLFASAGGTECSVRRRGSAEDVRGETSVLSTATCAPFQSGRPLAMTSIRRSSRRAGTTFRSRTSTCCHTVAPAS